MKLFLSKIGIIPVDVVDLPSGSFLAVDSKMAKGTYIYKNSGLRKTPHPYGEPEEVFQVTDAMYELQIVTFLGGSLPLYRGVARWHKTWHTIAHNGQLQSLGTGEFPDFSTNDSAFIPFTADRGTAVSAAISAKGMGDGGQKDRIEFVSGYTKDDQFPVGVVLKVTAKPNLTKLGFFNASEVQVHGPIPSSDYTIDRVFRMGTPLADIFPRANDGDGTLGTMMPDQPSLLEKAKYMVSYHGLIP